MQRLLAVSYRSLSKFPRPFVYVLFYHLLLSVPKSTPVVVYVASSRRLSVAFSFRLTS